MKHVRRNRGKFKWTLKAHCVLEGQLRIYRNPRNRQSILSGQLFSISFHQALIRDYENWAGYTEDPHLTGYGNETPFIF